MTTNTIDQTTAQLATIKLFAMGCHIQISLNTKTLSAQSSSIDQQITLLTRDIEHRLAYWAQIFSRFDDQSELMKLNSRTNQWVEVSSELFEVLQRAIDFVPKTQGLVTPTLLQPLWAAGYKHSFETLPKSPKLELMNQSRVSFDLDDQSDLQDGFVAYDFNPDHHSIERIQQRQADGQYQVYLPEGMALDLNGYVKGWCATKLAERISQSHDWQCPCLVDLGGDMAIGVPKDTDLVTWGVAVAKPYCDYSEHGNDEDVAILKISSGAVATSGQDYRRWWHGGWQHHLIHPHDLRPVASDVLTATVLTSDTMTAEVYAKYCVLLGVKQAIAWLNKFDIAAILIDIDHKVMTTSAMRPNLIAG